MSKDLNMALLLDFYGDMLTEKQRDMVDYYYNEDLSLSEIAENEGITRQGVRDAIKRAEAQMTEMEERLGLSARFTRVGEAARQIGELAEAVCLYPGTPKEVVDAALRIRDLANSLQKA